MTDREGSGVDRRTMLKWTGTAGVAAFAGCIGDGGGNGGEGTGTGGNSAGQGTSNGGGGGGGGGDQILLKTAGGSPGGTGYAIMNAMLSSASAEYPEISYNILPGGWVGNNTRLQNQEIHMGHTTLAAGTLMSNLEGPYTEYESDWESPPSNIRSVLGDQSELFYFAVAQSDFEYDTLKEAADDDYAIDITNQPEGTFGGFLWDTVLENLDYSQSAIEDLGGSYRRVGWNDAAQLFSDNQVDVILAVGGRDLGWLNGITANQEVKYLNWDDEFRTQISENYGVLEAELEGVFPGQSGTLRCTQDSGLINTHAGVSEEAVYRVTHGIIQRESQIQQSTGLLAPFEAKKEGMVDPVPFDLHPGAQRAYEEAGIL